MQRFEIFRHLTRAGAEQTVEVHPGTRMAME
jgi:hypothetical protein